MIAFGRDTRILQPDGKPFGRVVHKFKNEYEAAQDRHRRRVTSVILYGEDDELGSSDRKKLLNNSRDLLRNFSDAAWAIRKHLDFVSTFTFQPRTDDDGFNQALLDWMYDVSRPWRFEAAEKHRLDRFFRLMEASRTLDGDVFLMKLSDGRVQGIEGDRIRNAYRTDRAPDYDPDKFTHGIQTTKSGRHTRYCINARKGSMFEFERLEQARNIIPYGFYHRFDQVRGVTPLSSALNQFRDVYEGREYALLKSKVAQLFGLKFTADADAMPAGQAIQQPYGTEAATGQVADAAGNDPGGYDVDFSKGAVQLDLTGTPGHDAAFLENKTPSTEFQEFDKRVIAAALKSLDIPYSFYDESHTNFFGSKGALQQYIFSASIKRADHIELRDLWLTWRMGIAVANGELRLPRGRDFAWIDWEWVPKGLPWWKPLEEVKAQREAISAGLLSVPDACQDRGEDASAVADRQIRWEVETKRKREAAGLQPLPAMIEPLAPADAIPPEEK